MPRFLHFSALLAAISSALVAFTGLPSPAHATCLTSCKAELTFEDCTKPPMATWPLGTPLAFTSSCEVCCSAPGGPLNCSPSPVDTSTFSVRDGSFNPVAGTFAPINKKCADTDLFGFNGTLELGPHELISDNLILVQFDVVDPAMGSGGTGGTGGMGGGSGAMGGSSSSTSSGSGGAAPGQGGGDDESDTGCAIGGPSSEGGAGGFAVVAFALLGLVAGRRLSRQN